MSSATVLLLVGLWGAVLLPGAWRDRRSSPKSTVAGFSTAMQRLATCDRRRVMVYGNGDWAVHPRRSVRAELLERRRVVLVRLSGLVVAAVLTAVVVGGLLWWALVAVAVASFVGYLVALRVLKLRRERSRDVVALHAEPQAREAVHSRLEQYARSAADRTRAADRRRSSQAQRVADAHREGEGDREGHELPWAVGR